MSLKVESIHIEHLNQSINDEILEEIKPLSPRWILNFGFTNHTSNIRLADHFNSSHIIATNLKASHTEILNTNPIKNLKILEMNQIKQDFNAQFDLVLSTNLSIWFKDPTTSLREIKNLLRNQGKAIFAVPLINKLDMLIGLVSLNPIWRESLKNSSNPRLCFTQQEFLQIILEAGLKVDSHSLQYKIPHLSKSILIEKLLKELSQLEKIPKSQQEGFLEEIATSVAIHCSENGIIKFLIPIMKVCATNA